MRNENSERYFGSGVIKVDSRNRQGNHCLLGITYGFDCYGHYILSWKGDGILAKQA